MLRVKLWKYGAVSRDGQVVVEVEVDGGDVLVVVDTQLGQLVPLVWDAILFQVPGHVKNFAETFPRVGSSVTVQNEVTVQDLVDRFFRGYGEHVVVLRERVDNSDLPRAFRQATDAVAELIFPPRVLDLTGIPFRVWTSGSDMQKAAHRTVSLLSASLWVNIHFWLKAQTSQQKLSHNHISVLHRAYSRRIVLTPSFSRSNQ